jgi:hypothetical protein
MRLRQKKKNKATSCSSGSTTLLLTQWWYTSLHVLSYIVQSKPHRKGRKMELMPYLDSMFFYLSTVSQDLWFSVLFHWEIPAGTLIKGPKPVRIHCRFEFEDLFENNFLICYAQLCKIWHPWHNGHWPTILATLAPLKGLSKTYNICKRIILVHHSREDCLIKKKKRGPKNFLHYPFYVLQYFGYFWEKNLIIVFKVTRVGRRFHLRFASIVAEFYFKTQMQPLYCFRIHYYFDTVYLAKPQYSKHYKITQISKSPISILFLRKSVVISAT